jgi:hypothetical protein
MEENAGNYFHELTPTEIKIFFVEHLYEFLGDN